MHNLKAKVLLPKEDTTLTKVIKKSVLDDLAGRYESENQFLSMCTFLDPRFKMEYTCNKEELKKVKGICVAVSSGRDSREQSH